jgi:hypothetical protein
MNWKTNRLSIAVFVLLSPVCVRAQVESPLDDDTLSGLKLSYLKSYQIQPGQSHTFNFFNSNREPIKPQVAWSIEPQQSASIDPATGELTVYKSTPAGSVFEVKANIESGRRILSIKVYVFTPQTHPLVNRWKEKAEVACGSQKALLPANPIQELLFWADGTFSVTWRPFETYRDYWGTYTYSKEKGTIRFKVEGGSNIPANIDGEGYLTLNKNGELVLKGIWLGNKTEEDRPDVCRMIFVKSNDS